MQCERRACMQRERNIRGGQASMKRVQARIRGRKEGRGQGREGFAGRMP